MRSQFTVEPVTEATLASLYSSVYRRQKFAYMYIETFGIKVLFISDYCHCMACVEITSFTFVQWLQPL